VVHHNLCASRGVSAGKSGTKILFHSNRTRPFAAIGFAPAGAAVRVMTSVAVEQLHKRAGGESREGH
jgi:hypothetical protein